ncbi:MAG: helix-turn-helix domain-containing protein [Acidobacteria bacterium]|nr:helix-turn-helix domain-containing protein [Acidobacteriota bacterium]
MSQTLGARLRHRREQQGIALATIAERTKIKASLLAALERDDVSQWPTGIFRRSFVRGYAEAIGLDADAVVQEFQTVHHQHDDIEAAAAALAAVTGDTRGNPRPPTRIGTMLRSAIAAVSQRRRLHGDEAQGHDGDTASDERLPIGIGSPATAAPSPQPPTTDRAGEMDVVSPPPDEPGWSDPDLPAVARLCTEFARVEHVDQVQPLLRDAAGILDATGVIVWVWDEFALHLRPALAHGYSHRVLAQLPAVERDADNPTAAAFRSASAIGLSDEAGGALVVPLLASTGCVGVLALELPRGSETSRTVRAVAAIFAAMLVQLTGGAGPADAGVDAEESAPPVYSSSASMAARSGP